MLVLAALSVLVSCALVLHDVHRNSRPRRDRAAPLPELRAARSTAATAQSPAPRSTPVPAAPPRQPATPARPAAAAPGTEAGVLGSFPTTVERPPPPSRRVAAAVLLFAITLVVAGLTAVVIYGGLQALG